MQIETEKLEFLDNNLDFGVGKLCLDKGNNIIYRNIEIFVEIIRKIGKDILSLYNNEEMIEKRIQIV